MSEHTGSGARRSDDPGGAHASGRCHGPHTLELPAAAQRDDQRRRLHTTGAAGPHAVAWRITRCRRPPANLERPGRCGAARAGGRVRDPGAASPGQSGLGRRGGQHLGRLRRTDRAQVLPATEQPGRAGRPDALRGGLQRGATRPAPVRARHAAAAQPGVPVDRRLRVLSDDRDRRDPALLGQHRWRVAQHLRRRLRSGRGAPKRVRRRHADMSQLLAQQPAVPSGTRLPERDRPAHRSAGDAHRARGAAQRPGARGGARRHRPDPSVRQGQRRAAARVGRVAQSEGREPDRDVGLGRPVGHLRSQRAALHRHRAPAGRGGPHRGALPTDRAGRGRRQRRLGVGGRRGHQPADQALRSGRQAVHRAGSRRRLCERPGGDRGQAVLQGPSGPRAHRDGRGRQRLAVGGRHLQQPPAALQDQRGRRRAQRHPDRLPAGRLPVDGRPPQPAPGVRQLPRVRGRQHPSHSRRAAHGGWFATGWADCPRRSPTSSRSTACLAA